MNQNKKINIDKSDLDLEALQRVYDFFHKMALYRRAANDSEIAAIEKLKEEYTDIISD
ncbi:MAG: hypothetical protein JKY93_00990 [Gammaproteobacteria bacterium]|nr:hypothetical protein [Gammaproteobacteria bacterium]